MYVYTFGIEFVNKEIVHMNFNKSVIKVRMQCHWGGIKTSQLFTVAINFQELHPHIQLSFSAIKVPLSIIKIKDNRCHTNCPWLS